MRFGRRHHRERVRAVEITPMIDVVFLLIIFFMTTARFAQITRAELDLPQERGEQRAEGEEAGIIVNITAEGEIIIGQELVTLAGLETFVAAETARARGPGAERLRLTVRADRNADAGRLNEVVSLLQRLGVGAARVATEVP